MTFIRVKVASKSFFALKQYITQVKGLKDKLSGSGSDRQGVGIKKHRFISYAKGFDRTQTGNQCLKLTQN